MNIMNNLWSKMASGSFDEMQHEVSEIVYLGFPMSAMLAQLHDDAIKKKELTDVDKALICERIAEVSMSIFGSSFFDFL